MMTRQRLRLATLAILFGLCLVPVVEAEEAKGELADYTALAQPGFADRIGLTDEQQSTIARILDDRVNALARAAAAERPMILAESNRRLAELLTDEQSRLFAAMTSEGQLRFNFRQQKWPEVLDWFARQADLSLVMDTSPPGTFTYSDTKDYSPSEAIDLLNSVLLGKGFTLIRRDRMLLVVEVAKGIPYDLVPQVSMEQLSRRGRFELVSVLFPLGAKPVDAVVTEISGLLGEYGKSTPLPQTKQLLVTETAGRMQAINVVIASVPEPVQPAPPAPQPPPPVPVFSTYSAEGLDLAAAAETLRGMFEDAKIQADSQTLQIHVFGVPNQQVAVKAAIDQMVANAQSDKGPQLKIYPLDTDDLTKVQSQLAATLPNVQVSIDAAERRLLIVATAAEHNKVRDTLEQLGAAAPSVASDTTVVVFDVPDEDTAALTTLLQQILPRADVVATTGRITVRGDAREQELARSTLDQMRQSEALKLRPTIRFFPLRQRLENSMIDAMKRVVPQATIARTADEKQLSVVARPPDHELFEATLRQIEADLPAPAERRLQVYAVTQEQRERWNALLPDLKDELASVKWIEDSAPDEVAAFATDEQHAAIRRWLDQLAEVTDPDQPRTLHRFPIAVREPPRLVSLLQGEFPQTQILLNDQQDALLVWDRADRLDPIKQKLEELASVLPQRQERTLAVYPVKDHTVRELQQMLGPAVTDANISPDPSGRRLIVWATAKDHASIQTVLDKIAAAVDAGDRKRLEMYDVPEWDAAAILADVKSLVPAAETRLDTRNQRLIVIATGDEHERVATLVAQFAKKANDTQRVLIAYSLEHADPEAVLVMLKELRPDVAFAADVRARRMLVTAPLREQPRLQAVIEQLDAAPDDDSEQMLQSYKLTLEDPSVVLPLLQPLLPHMQLSVDPRARQLIAKGSELDHQRLERALGRINDPTVKNGSVRMYDVGTADSEQVKNVLKQLVPSAVVAADPVGRRVLVWAPEEDQLSVQQAMQQFTQQPAGELRSLESYRVPVALGANVLVVLQNAVPGAALSLDAQQQHVICWGTAAQQEILARAVQGLRPSRSDALLQLHTALPAVLQNARTLVADLAPDAQVMNGADESKWLVFGTSAEQQAIGQLLTTLSEQLDPHSVLRSIHVYTLKPRQVDSARQLIGQELPAARMLPSPDPRRLMIQATAEQHARIETLLTGIREALTGSDDQTLQSHAVRRDVRDAVRARLTSQMPAVEFVSSPDLDSLTAWAAPEEHLRIDEIVQQFQRQVEPPADRELTVYDLRSASVASVREMIAGLWPDVSFVPNSMPSRLVVQATASQQEKIAELIERVENASSVRSVIVQVYPAGDRITAQSIVAALDTQMTRDAVVQVNEATNSLVVSADEPTQQRIEAAITSLKEQLPAGPDLAVDVYRLKNTSPSAAATVLQSLLPAARIAADENAKTLSASARPSDQVLIRRVIEQMEASASSTDQVTRIYRLKNASVVTASNTFRTLLPDAKIGFDPASDAVVVTATADEQTEIAEAVELLDGQIADSFVRVYPAGDRITAQSIAAALDTQVTRDAVVQVNEATNSLVVSADEPTQQRIEAAITSLKEQLPAGPDLAVEVHRFKDASPSSAANVLQSLLPTARFAVDENAKTLAAAARPGDQALIRRVVEQLEASAPGADQVTRIYRMRQASARTASNTFQSLLPDAKIGFDPASDAVIVTATADEQTEIAKAVELLDGDVTGSVVQVYPFDRDQVLAETVRQSLDGALRDRVAIQINQAANSLIVRGSDEAQQRIRSAITAIVDQLPPARKLVTRVYPLRLAGPDVVRDALVPLLPQGQVSSDNASGSVIVSAYPDEQVRVADVVARLDVVSDRQPTLQVYPLHHAQGSEVFQSVSQAMAGNRDISMTYQAESKSVFVVATPKNQQLVRDLLQVLDRVDVGSQPRTAKAYPLRNSDGTAVSASLNMLFRDRQPPVTVQFDATGNSLVVVGTLEQHDEAARTLEQLEGDERQLEVFVLRHVEPYVVEDAVRELFSGAPRSSAPSVSADLNSQRLFVRATKPQIEQIRTMLAKLGEVNSGEFAKLQSGNVRTIPFSGDTDEAMRQIEVLWPRLRPNRIEVIRPAVERLFPVRPDVLEEIHPRRQTPKPADDAQSLGPDRIPYRWVAFTDAEVSVDSEAVGPVDSTDPRPARIGQVPLRKPPEMAEIDPSELPPAPVDPTMAPNVVVVPDPDRITIASSDEGALDQLESLLRAMSLRVGPHQGSNFAVFLLRNAGAREVEELLTDLFDRLPLSRSGVGDAVFVADERLNALVVHGTPKERGVVKEILQVLDTEDLPDPLNSQRPQLIALRFTSAIGVLPILQSIYKTQLTSGGGRRPMPIPDGLSADVALVLQQINAASSGPVLTLEADQTSNSIVMRAPQELGREIISFVQKLDEQAAEPSDRVRVISLQGTDANVMRDALQLFLQRARKRP